MPQTHKRWWTSKVLLLLVAAGGALVAVALLLDSDEEGWSMFAGWAEAQPGAVDPETGWPRKVRRVADGATMVLVHGGVYQMGALPNDEERWSDEKRHRIKIKPFYMDAHEVTFAQFHEFVETTGYVTEASSIGKGFGLAPPGSRNMATMIPGLSWRDCNPCREGARDAHPVSCVTWSDAVAYCRWVGATLPSEEEFEYALLLDAGETKYPWGSDDIPPDGFANVLGLEAKQAYPQARIEPVPLSDGFVGTAPVMSFGPNSLGLYDLCGNVAEWCAGVHWSPYKPGMLRLILDDDDGVVRGGSWVSSRKWLRAAVRQPADRRIVRDYIGFRCIWRPVADQGN